MSNSNTLSNIRVSKVDLLRILKENLDAHNEVYNASYQAYLEAKRAEIEEGISSLSRLEALLKGKLEKLEEDGVNSQDIVATTDKLRFLRSIKPVSHEKDYTTAIKKIELSVDDEFTLTDNEFDAYILNEWEWKSSFIANATTYATGHHNAPIVSGLGKFSKV